MAAEQQTITFARFQQLALESEDNEGRVSLPILRDWHAEAGWVLTMYWRGLIKRSGPEPRQWQKTGPWVITEAGRDARAALDVPTPAHVCMNSGTSAGPCKTHCGDEVRCWGTAGVAVPRHDPTSPRTTDGDPA